jgi:hypothetical protein
MCKRLFKFVCGQKGVGVRVQHSKRHLRGGIGARPRCRGWGHITLLTEIGRLVHFKEGKPFIIRVYQEYCPKTVERRERRKKEKECRCKKPVRHFTLQPNHNHSPATPLVLLRESSVLKVVHQHSKQNLRDQAAVSVEGDTVNIAEAIVELDLGHVGSELQQGLLEVGLLGSDLLAVAVAGDLDGARQWQAEESLLRGDDAAEVE